MEHDERSDEVEGEIERLERESKELEGEIEQTRSEWEARKSDTSQAPGATDPEAAGPHNVDSEDPATGRKYGEKERSEEFESAQEEDAEADADG
jgi:hypothetical protein